MRKSISFQFKKRINEWSEVKTKNMSKIYTLHVLNLKQSLPLHLMGLFLYILQRENPSCHMHLSLSFSWPTLSSISLWKLEKYNVCEGPFSDNVGPSRRKDPEPCSCCFKGLGLVYRSKMSWLQTKWCTKQESYNTYILANKKYIYME